MHARITIYRSKLAVPHYESIVFFIIRRLQRKVTSRERTSRNFDTNLSALKFKLESDRIRWLPFCGDARRGLAKPPSRRHIPPMPYRGPKTFGSRAEPRAVTGEANRS